MHQQNHTSYTIKNLKDGMLRNKINIIYLGWLIAVLNIFDGVTTAYGLKNGKIEELNPIMAFLWMMSPPLFLALKFSLSVLIVIISMLVYKKSSKKFQGVYSVLLVGVCCVYLGIFFLHIMWLSFL